ncbi:MAG TPA: chemotaxis protein CheW [Nitrospiraceae bacterium]|nr:chemotaxis protein CheW [Nitrospiraceae bacterium]
MLTTRLGLNSKTTTTCTLVVFSVGGQRFATRTEEVGGVWPWTNAMPVPSGTEFVNAIMRRGEDVLPVYDLAAKLNVQVRGTATLCLIAKRKDGPMAIRIDEEIPTLHVVEEASIHRTTGTQAEAANACLIGTDDVPIYSFRW